MRAFHSPPADANTLASPAGNPLINFVDFKIFS